MKNELILVLDFGGQYKELIARRIREIGVYSLIKPCDITKEELTELSPIGIILTGGPNSVYDEKSPKAPQWLYTLGIPVLGICYGMQATAYALGGSVVSCKKSEYGEIACKVDESSLLFDGLDKAQTVLMSHTDRVDLVPNGFRITASTALCTAAAIEDEERGVYCTQFHPEVVHTKNGFSMLKNFAVKICKAKCDYSMDDFVETKVKEIAGQVGDANVILGLSGGVDSSVCAALIGKAIGKQLTCIFVDHGLMRKNEGDDIEKEFSKHDINFVRVNAEERFLRKLAGVTEPEKKRKIIGAEFVAVFQEEASKIKGEYLAQGTIYPDVIESGAKNSAVIKSHHNVGGLPKDIGFKGIVEPLRMLFKDEVRKVGKKLGLSDKLVMRQPFPGPGLSVRVIGEITKEKLDILREADYLFTKEVDKLKNRPNQYFAVLTDTKSVGVMGDFRTYDYVVALRAVVTNDFMTCEWANLPFKLLKKVSSNISNEVKGVNRVVYDITGKPPATIEWE